MSPVLKQATPVQVQSGHGVYLTDLDGRDYLDFTAGIGVTSTGHCHPRVVDAAQRQAAARIHGQYTTVMHQPLQQLIVKLGDVLPAGLNSVFLTNSGSEAVEASLRLARHATGRPNVITFHGGFHGRTVAAASMNTSGTGFMIYIMLGHRIANTAVGGGDASGLPLSGIDQLGLSMFIAAVVATPFGIIPAAITFSHPVWLLWGIGVGVSSSVIPYVTDQLAMARLPRATFSLMLALLPAAATVIGLIVLGQVPTVRDLAGIGLVILGVAVHRDRPRSHAPESGCAALTGDLDDAGPGSSPATGQSGETIDSR